MCPWYKCVRVPRARAAVNSGVVLFPPKTFTLHPVVDSQLRLRDICLRKEMPEHLDAHASNGSTTPASKLPSLGKSNSLTSSGMTPSSSMGGGHGHVRTSALSAAFQSLSFKGASFLKKKDGGATAGVAAESDRRSRGGGTFSHRKGQIRGQLIKVLKSHVASWWCPGLQRKLCVPTACETEGLCLLSSRSR